MIKNYSGINVIKFSVYFHIFSIKIVNRQSAINQSPNRQQTTHNPQHTTQTSMSHVIALDLGGTKLSAAIFNEDAHCSHRKSFLLSGKTGKAVSELIIETIQILIKEAANDHIKISTIGICVPGISYSKTGCVWAPNIPGWEDFPLHAEIEEAVKAQNIKVVVDNDRACSVLGERWKGAASGCEDVIFLAVGTGIGAGIITNGKVLRGAHDIAGAVGWLALNKPYDLKYKTCGCFEYYASGQGLVCAAKEFRDAEKNYNGTLSKTPIDTRAIFNAYEKNDIIAQKTIQQAIHYWGIAAANFVSIFNPEKIIFGGGVFGPATKFLPDIKKEAEQWAQPISIKQVELAESELGSDAALYGAGWRALTVEL